MPLGLPATSTSTNMLLLFWRCWLQEKTCRKRKMVVYLKAELGMETEW